MNNSMVFESVAKRPDLVPAPVFETINNWSGPQEKNNFWVAEIDPEFAGGIELCQKYNIDIMEGVNCLIVRGVRGNKQTIAACLVPVGYKYNMNGVIRKVLNARQVSVAPLDFVLAESKMEYGSITPVGLPEDWLKLIDPLVLKSDRIIIGGGYKKSKLSIPSSALLYLPNAIKLEGVAKAS